MSNTADIVIIGGGVMGASIAWNLKKRGAGKVILLERDNIATGATGKSSAIIRTHYLHPVLARMALHARKSFEHFAETVGGESGFHNTGFIAISAPGDEETAREIVVMNNDAGIRAQVLTPGELHALEPRLDASPEFTGAAVWEPDSGYADPVLTAQSYAAAARDLGVEIRVGAAVCAIRANGRVNSVKTDRETIQTEKVIVAAGYRTRDLVAPLGFDAPLTPVRHTMAVIRRTKDFGAMPPIVSDRVFGVYSRPDVGDLTFVGTTAPYDGDIDYAVESERPADDTHVQNQAERFLRRWPSQQAAALRQGFSGVYDCSADLQPLLGPIPDVQGVYIACGFSGHGFKLSPVVGEMMADQVLGNPSTPVDITFFDPARFLRNEPIKMQFSYSSQTL